MNHINTQPATARQVVGNPSKQSRDLFDTGPHAVREVFEYCSAVAEADPNNTRRNTEVVPNLFRSRVEARPKGVRTAPEETTNNNTRNVRLVYRECTVSVRGVYRKGTGEVLKRYWRAVNRQQKVDTLF